MDYKQIIRMGEMPTKKVGACYRHPRSRPRQPLKISARQYATQLLQGRLTTRDLELARALIGVGMLTRHQAQRLFFADNAKLASNRLVKLYHYHFLDRSTYWLVDMAYEGFEPCYIYTIGATGLEAFAQRMGMGRSEVPYAPGRYTLSREDHFLLHDLQVSEMFTQLRLGSMAKGCELIWFNESAAIQRTGEEEVVRPDGFAILMGQERQLPFFIEMDRGNTDWAHKVAAYERGRQRVAWQIGLRIDGWQPTTYPAVLCVIPNGLEREVVGAIAGSQARTRFYLKSWHTFLTTDIFTDWYESQSGQMVAL